MNVWVVSDFANHEGGSVVAVFADHGDAVRWTQRHEPMGDVFVVEEFFVRGSTVTQMTQRSTS